MKRIATLIGILAIAAAACSSGTAGAGGSGTPGGETPPPTGTPTAAIPSAVPSATPSPADVPIGVSVVYDGSSCVYAGPAVFPEGSIVKFSFVNTKDQAAQDLPMGLVVGAAKEGTTWSQILADATDRPQDAGQPSWALGAPWAVEPPGGTTDARFVSRETLDAEGASYLQYYRAGTEFGVLCMTDEAWAGPWYPAALLYLLTD